jgi:hypothetical protein
VRQPAKAKPRKVARPRHAEHPLGKVGNWDVIASSRTVRDVITARVFLVKSGDAWEPLGEGPLVLKWEPRRVVDELDRAFPSLEAALLVHARGLLAKAGLGPYADLKPGLRAA